MTDKGDLMNELARRTGLVPGEHAPAATVETAETEPVKLDEEPGSAWDQDKQGELLTSPPPTITISVSRKINLGNYESADAFVSLSGITAGMTQEDMEPLLETGKIGWELLRAAIHDKVQEMRRDADRAGGYE